jgi:hypothetical protein
MTTQVPPFAHGNFEGDLGYSYVFAAQRILLVMQDRLNALDLGVVPLVGDFAGTGTDTIRVTHMGNIGWSLPMTALGSETDTITPSNLTTGYSTVALGMYGLGHAETYKQQTLSRELEVLVDALKARLPESWLATFRELVCNAGAGFSTAVGAAGTQLSVDDLLDLTAVSRSTRGSRRPTMFLDGNQVNQALESARNEPAFQAAAQTFQEQQAWNEMDVIPDFLKLGVTCAITNDVDQSGGAYQGFAFSPGGIGWAVASTSRVKVANPQGAILVPEMGLIVEEITSGSSQATRKYEARSMFGVAAGDSSVFMQRRVISVV